MNPLDVTLAWREGCRCSFCWRPIILAIGLSLRRFVDATSAHRRGGAP